jgi:hypothetical protein
MPVLQDLSEEDLTVIFSRLVERPLNYVSCREVCRYASGMNRKLAKILFKFACRQVDLDLPICENGRKFHRWLFKAPFLPVQYTQSLYLSILHVGFDQNPQERERQFTRLFVDPLNLLYLPNVTSLSLHLESCDLNVEELKQLIAELPRCEIRGVDAFFDPNNDSFQKLVTVLNRVGDKLETLRLRNFDDNPFEDVDVTGLQVKRLMLEDSPSTPSLLGWIASKTGPYTILVLACGSGNIDFLEHASVESTNLALCFVKDERYMDEFYLLPKFTKLKRLHIKSPTDARIGSQEWLDGFEQLPPSVKQLDITVIQTWQNELFLGLLQALKSKSCFQHLGELALRTAHDVKRPPILDKILDEACRDVDIEYFSGGLEFTRW